MTLLKGGSSGPSLKGGAGGYPRPAVAHLRSLDVVRIVVVAGVISVHTVTSTTPGNSQLGNAIVSLLHVNREIFLLLSAFVLTYAYGRRNRWKVTTFWKRRYLLVVTPYVCWSAIYLGVNSGSISSVGQGFERFGYDLLTANAEFQLYFLLLTMQLYLIFPLLLKALKALRQHHLALLAVSFAAQIALTAVFFYWPPSSGILGYWVRHPNANLLSYQLYIIAGGVAALHLDQFATWVSTHRRLVIGSVGVTLALGLTNYLADISFLHMNVLHASQVFQPLIAVEAVVFAIGLFCIGQWMDQRNSPRVLQAASVGSDASFGVYLSHVLILFTLLLPLLRDAGILRAVKGAGTPVTLLFDLAVIPLVYATCVLGVSIARRTPLSLALTGRQARPTTTRAGARPPLKWIATPRTAPSPVANSITS